MTDFKSLNLAAPVHKALERLGYEKPTPIQAKAIPDVLQGRDLMGIAQTGTGKTAAFTLPFLSHIANDERDPPKRGARVLVLAPTRELASQISESVREYGVCIPTLTVACVFGGVPIARQIKKLVRGNDVLVATPGRLIDLMDRKDVRLNEIEVLVLDEADQMMDMGFIHALKKIVPNLPKDRQTLFFSATMTPKIKKLASQFLTDPVQVTVSPPNTTADKIDQSIIFVNKGEKQDLLALTLLDQSIERALVFTRTKHGADRVVKRLARVGLEGVAIHGNKSQSKRQRALKAFKEGEIRFLIATDVAARGIDIEGISHVINFEIPNVPEQYVHRIGRTARAGRDGQAIAFVDKEERAYLKDIQKLLKVTIPVMPLPEDFLNKIKEVNKRAPLPRAERADNYHKPGQDPRRKKFKKKKKPQSAEELLNSEGGKSAERKAPKSHKKWEKRDKKTGASDSEKPNHNSREDRGRSSNAKSGDKPRKYSADKPSWASGDKHKNKKKPAHRADNDRSRSEGGERSSSGSKPNHGSSGNGKPQNKYRGQKPGKPGQGSQGSQGKSFNRKPRKPSGNRSRNS